MKHHKHLWAILNINMNIIIIIFEVERVKQSGVYHKYVTWHFLLPEGGTVTVSEYWGLLKNNLWKRQKQSKKCTENPKWLTSFGV